MSRGMLRATAWLAARSAAALLVAGCGGPLPPGPERASDNLRLHATFAHHAERHGLGQTYDLLARPEAFAARPAPGLTPLLYLQAAELRTLRRRLADPAERHALDMLEDRVFWMQLEADPDVMPLVRRLRAVRSTASLADGVELESRLVETGDPASRRALWLAQAAAAADTEPLLRDLARARNLWARRRHGTQDLLALARARRGCDPAVAGALRDQVARALAPPPDEERVAPWDAQAGDPELFARLEERLDAERHLGRARALLAWVGLPPEPPALTITPATGSGAGFASAASFPVDPPVDVRVVVRVEAGLYPHWTTLHEIGHAAQALLAPSDGIDLARRLESPAVAEACGKVGERLAFAPEWLRREGVAEDDIAALGRWERRSERWRVRSILADTALEERLYADPEGDLDRAFVRLQDEVVAVRVPAGGERAWALEKNVVFRPLGRLDYLLARCAQAAIYRRLRRLPGGLLGAAAGRLVRDEVLATASGQRFEDWFRLAAATAPSCDAWLEDVLAAGAPPATGR